MIESGSVIDALTSTVRTRPNPVISLEVHVLAFPLECQAVGTRSRPFFDYLLLAWSRVLKFGVRAEAVEGRFVFFLLADLVGSHDSVEGSVAERNRRVCAWCRFNRLPLLHFKSFFLVLLYPKFMSSFVHLDVVYLLVRVTATTSRRQIVSYVLSVFVEEVLFAFVPFFGFEVGFVFLDLFVSFVEMIGSRGGSGPILLLHLNAVQIAVFAQTEI